ncbi:MULTISPECIES: hypothetical protein [Cyanophyceae]|uniref:Uncharacterized protein n=1 Tax=Leptolyngbya subtilissima DQ-A4 TaxID=2933933 RepID=A0ABV0K6M2_9CYAN|nr:hypothetical protein [Nodosilinea sp. FACHB-141]MBD2113575.1 hypothetical protein [Nodosilinea sp. FACHB-141]
MSFTRWLRRLAPLMMCLVLLVSACTSASSKYDQVQDDTTGFGSPAAVDKKAEKGGTFNAFFPDNQSGYNVTPYQEKKGFAEYKLEQDGKTVAMLTISDTTSVPGSAEKYSAATQSIGGFPTVEQGSTATGVLVNDRYQVKVLSRDPSFTKEDRAAWLEKFDLQGLAQLKGAINPGAKPSAALPQSSTAAPARPKDGFKLPRVKLPSVSPSLQPAS